MSQHEKAPLLVNGGGSNRNIEDSSGCASPAASAATLGGHYDPRNAQVLPEYQNTYIPSILRHLRNDPIDSDFSGTIFNMIKTVTGAGVLALPAGIRAGGLIVAVVGFALFGVISTYTMNLIVRCQRLACGTQGACSYPDLGAAAFGRFGRIAVWISFMTICLCCCSAYLVFIGTELEILLKDYADGRFTKVVCMAMSLFGLCLLALLRSLKFLAPMSIVGSVAIVVGCVAGLAELWVQRSFLPIEKLSMANVSGIPTFASIGAFFFFLHCMLPDMEQVMVEPRRFKTATTAASAAIFLFTIPWAILCYLLVGSETDGAVVNNMRAGVVKNVVLTSLVICVYLGYPLYAFSVCSQIEKTFIIPSMKSYFLNKRAVSREGASDGVAPDTDTSPLSPASHNNATITKREHFMIETTRNLHRFAFIGATMFLSAVVHEFETMTVLCGAVGCCPLSFVFPSLFFLKLRHDRAKHFADLHPLAPMVLVKDEFSTATDSEKALIVANLNRDVLDLEGSLVVGGSEQTAKVGESTITPNPEHHDGTSGKEPPQHGATATTAHGAIPKANWDVDEDQTHLDEVGGHGRRRGIMWHVESVVCGVTLVMGILLIVSTIVMFAVGK